LKNDKKVRKFKDLFPLCRGEGTSKMYDFSRKPKNKTCAQTTMAQNRKKTGNKMTERKKEKPKKINRKK